jgi:hypothetical protein
LICTELRKQQSNEEEPLKSSLHAPYPAGAALASLVTVTLITVASVSPLRAQPPGGASGELASKRFKNIRVLKNLPADRLIPVMRGWSESLGVRCDFCHVEGPNHTGFEKDDKPTKRMARQMVTMTEDLNKHQRILDNRATCYLCHHGKPEPEARPGAEGPGREGPGRPGEGVRPGGERQR